MQKTLTIRRKLFLTLPAVLMLSSVLAQPGGGGDPDPGQPVPIQGVVFLLLAGAFLGIKKLMQNKKHF